MDTEDIMILVVNLITASRAAGFCRGRGINDEPYNKAEDEALSALKSAISELQDALKKQEGEK